MTTELKGACLASLSEGIGLASAVARQANVPLIPLEERRFEGGEFKLRPLESVRGRTVFVLESLAGSDEMPVCERLVRLLFLLQGLRDVGAAATVALLPYLAFARKERRTQPRDPVTSRYAAELIEASGVAQVVALDVHNPAAFENAFRVPTVHLTALPMIVDLFAHMTAEATDTGRVGVPRSAAVTIVSPDVGGIKRAQLFREQLAARTGLAVELAFIEKRRAKGIVTTGVLAGEVAGRTVIVLDDLCATGGTLIRAAEACRIAGAAAVHVAVTHTPLAKGLDALLAADQISRIVATDSVGIAFPAARSTRAVSGKLVTLSTAPLFGEVVRRMIAGEPLSPLLEHWPLPSA
jgi:ribose-phosphate pyrophosphokinase